ncbi:membrane protein insertase YidC [Desulfocurvus sp. DL9XJH121]
MDNDNNTKRTILAIVLCTIVLVGWSYFFSPKQQPVQPGQETAQVQPGQEGGTAPVAPTAPVVPVAPPAFTPAAGQDVTVDTPLFRAVFNSAGGVLTDFELKNFKESIEDGAPLVNLVSPDAVNKGLLGLLWNGEGTWRGAQWAAPEAPAVALEPGGETSVTFSGALGDLHVKRTLTFKADSYLIQERVSLVNAGATPLSGRLGFTLASKALSAENDRYNPTRVSWLDKDGVDNENDTGDLGEGLSRRDALQWSAVQSNYFAMAVTPEEGDLAMHARYDGGLYRLQVDKENVDVPAGGMREVTNTYFFGPVTAKTLAAAPHGMDELVTYGFFDILSKPLLQLLNFLYGWVGNWGVAIILLTIIIKIVFWPLSNKSYRSMNSMKKIQPLMAKIREQYKDDRQKMNQEMMQLYKTYKVNPAGGCLPMALQIPVFFGLYQALLGAIELRHASFIPHLPFTDMIWLADLSAKDPYYITPLIMGATMFLQQKMTPAPGDPTQAKVMLFMPVIFTFLFLNFPSGLVVYWLVNNVLSIAQQWSLTRKA